MSAEGAALGDCSTCRALFSRLCVSSFPLKSGIRKRETRKRETGNRESGSKLPHSESALRARCSLLILPHNHKTPEVS